VQLSYFDLVPFQKWWQCLVGHLHPRTVQWTSRLIQNILRLQRKVEGVKVRNILLLCAKLVPKPWKAESSFSGEYNFVSFSFNTCVCLLADLLTVDPHTPTPEPVKYDKTDGQWYTHDGVDIKETQQRKGYINITSTTCFKLEVKSHACFSVTDLNINHILYLVMLNGVRTFVINDAPERSGLL